MIDFLLGVPGKLKTLTDRLTAARAGYLDNLSAGMVAPATTALSTATWTAGVAAKANGAAQETTAMLTIPKVSGILTTNVPNIATPGALSLSAGQILCGSIADAGATTASATFVDVVNYTGSGLLEFAAFWAYVSGGLATTYQVEILIDGISVYTHSFGISAEIACPVGNVLTSVAGGLLSAQGGYPAVFKSSLQIRHKVASGTNPGACVYKMRKTV